MQSGRVGLALCGLLIAGVPLLADAAPSSETPAPVDSYELEGALDDLHIPGFDGRPPRSSIELEIAPEIASHNPLGADSRTSTTTDVSLTFAHVHQLSDQFEVEFDAGPSFTFDSGDVSGSSLGATLELRTRPSSSGFAAFARYGVARDFDDFFEDGLDTVQTLTAGGRYVMDVGPGAIGLELAPRWVNSSQDLDDYIAGELFVDALMPVNDDILVIAELAVDRRWYLNVDPVILTERRDWRFEVFAGVDIAGALAPSGGPNPIRALGVGVLWLEVDSNLASADRSSIKVLPAVTAGVSF